MATKNLLRSMMEGARNERSRREARACKRANRASARVALRMVACDPEAWEWEGVIVADRRPVDVTSPLKDNVVSRWLESQTGKPWEQVYSRLKSRLGSVHFALEEALRYIVHSPELRNGNRIMFVVDSDGMFRADFAPSSKERGVSRVPREEILEWLAWRKVIERGPYYFWGEPTPYAYGFDMVKGYRQNKRFSAEDIEFFNKLPEATRTRVIDGTF